MSRDLQQLVAAKETPRLIQVYDTALEILVNSFRAPYSLEIEDVRDLIVNKHPGVVRDAILSGQRGVMTWMHDKGLFLAKQADMALLYMVIRQHNAAPDIFMEVSSLFNRFAPSDPQDEAYVKCKFSLGPKFDPDLSGNVRGLLRKCWAEDDEWMVVRIAEYYYGMNCDTSVPASPQDVVDLINMAIEMLPRAPRTTAEMAPRFAVYLASLGRLPEHYRAVDAAIQRLNVAARSKAGRLSTSANVHKNAPDTTWPQLLALACASVLPLPADRVKKIGVLRQQLYVCHEVEDVIPPHHVRAIQTAYQGDPDVAEYTKLCLERGDAVLPIEIDVLRWLCGWQRGQDISSTSQVHAYLVNLERRCRAQGLVAQFMSALRENGLESVERIFIS